MYAVPIQSGLEERTVSHTMILPGHGAGLSSAARPSLSAVTGALRRLDAMDYVRVPVRESGLIPALT